MTLSDLIAQLERLRKEMKATTLVKLGKEYNVREDVFDSFDVAKNGDSIVFIPSDRWRVSNGRN